MSGKDAINIGDLTPQQRLDVARCEKVSGEEVEVVQYQCREIGETGWEECGSEGYNYCNRSALHDTRTLMTVAQHQRITDALLEDARYNYQLALDWQDKVIALQAQLAQQQGAVPDGWRNHSVNYARGERCPQNIETLQAAWDRDQELIEEQRAEIAKHKQTINQLRQKSPATVQGVNAQLLEALDLMVSTHDEGGWPTATITIARAAIAAARKGEGE